MDINTAFTRLMLRSVMREVNLLTTAAERKRVWVYNFGHSHWEFQQGPDDFYWHGSADNAYDARANGWRAWLTQLERNREALVTRLGPKRDEYLWLQRGHALWAWDTEQARLVKLRRRWIQLGLNKGANA